MQHSIGEDSSQVGAEKKRWWRTCEKGKVTICHIPPGNLSNFHDICVSRKSKHLHMKRNPLDKIGSCEKHCPELCSNKYTVSYGRCRCSEDDAPPTSPPSPHPSSKQVRSAPDHISSLILPSRLNYYPHHFLSANGESNKVSLEAAFERTDRPACESGK